MAIYRIDFGLKNKKYVGTQYVEVPNKSLAKGLVEMGYIFNKKARRLIRIKKVGNIKKEQKIMEKEIRIRKPFKKLMNVI